MVNVTDREALPFPGNDAVWVTIYDMQRELHYEFRKVEWELGLGYGLMNRPGVNQPTLDNRYLQAYIKDLMWRFTEEIQEAKEALLLGHQEHFHEELIDALHFMMELNVVVGIPKTRLFQNSGIPATDAIYYFGLAANCLKNKAWKQTEQLTDVNKFKSYVCQGNERFRQQLLINMSLDEIWELYSKKHQVNQFRIGSSY